MHFIPVTEQYYPVVLFVMLSKIIVTFESVDEILNRDHSDKRYAVVLFWGDGAVYYVVGTKLF